MAAIASMPPSHCLGTIEMRKHKFPIVLARRKCLGALALSKTKNTCPWIISPCGESALLLLKAVDTVGNYTK